MRKSGAITRGVLGAVLALFVASSASAALVLVGDLQPSGSSIQRFRLENVGPIDRIVGHIVFGNSFKDKPIENLTAPGWSYDLAADGSGFNYGGSDVDKAEGEVHFFGHENQTFEYCFHAYHGSEEVESDKIYHNGETGSSDVSHCDDKHDDHSGHTAVPEAGALFLFGTGLVGLVGYRRVRRMQ
jgi:hypothetical protein